MARRQKHRDSTYRDIYDTISAVKTLNFKPKTVRQYAKDPATGKKAYVRTVREFTPQQKATLARMALNKNVTDDGDIYYTKSHLYNLANMVKEGEADFIRFTGTKKRQRSVKNFAKKKGFFVTDKGTFNTVENAKQSRFVKAPEGYRLEFVTQTPTKPKGRGEEVAFIRTRREIFVPFPREIIGWPEAIEQFIKDLQKTYKTKHFRLAVNGHQGRTQFTPSEMFKYMFTLTAEDEDETPLFEMENPFINGVYLIYKEQIRQPRKRK